MATPISFTPVLEWVDYTDPTNVPQQVRVISAADLLRYENSHKALTDRVNEHDSLIINAGTAINGVADRVTQVEVVNTGQGDTIAQMAATIANLTSQLNALNRTTVVRSVTTAYNVLATNRYHIHTGGAATYTLPPPGTNAGLDFWFHNKGTATLTIGTTGNAQVIQYNNATSINYNMGAGTSLLLVSDGTHWVVVVSDMNATI